MYLLYSWTMPTGALKHISLSIYFQNRKKLLIELQKKKNVYTSILYIMHCHSLFCIVISQYKIALYHCAIVKLFVSVYLLAGRASIMWYGFKIISWNVFVLLLDHNIWVIYMNLASIKAPKLYFYSLRHYLYKMV